MCKNFHENEDSATECNQCGVKDFATEQIIAPRKFGQLRKQGVKSIVGGLTELITNSNSSHVEELGSNHNYNTPAFVKIEIWKNEDKIVVTDNAAGFFGAKTSEDGIAKFREYSAKKESHATYGRNLFGAGLTDTIGQDKHERPGQIVWKTPGGDYCGMTHFTKAGRQTYLTPLKPTGDHKKDIPDHGTQITFFWSRSQRPIPKFDDLCEKLRIWFELKNILRKDSPLKVLLVYHDERGRERTKDNFLHKFWGYEKTPIPGIDDLKNEKVPGEIVIVGNTVLDNLVGIDTTDEHKVLVTMHRRENHENIQAWFKQIDKIASENKRYEFCLPIHPNPAVEKHKNLLKNVKVVEPMEYNILLDYLSKCSFVITDSGGIQEESAFLRKPCLVCREETERAEGLGNFSLLCAFPEDLAQRFEDLSSLEMSGDCPYGDGKSSEKIIRLLKNDILCCTSQKRV